MVQGIGCRWWLQDSIFGVQYSRFKKKGISNIQCWILNIERKKEKWMTII